MGALINKTAIATLLLLRLVIYTCMKQIKQPLLLLRLLLELNFELLLRLED